MYPEERDTAQIGLYQEYENSNEYFFESGICVLPIAEDPPENPIKLLTWSPVVTLRFHSPYRIRKVNYSIQKDKNPPVFPAPTDSGAHIFLNGSIEITNQINTSMRTFDWSMSGTYTYVEKCVSDYTHGLVLGSPPFRYPSELENQVQYWVGGNQNLIYPGAVNFAGIETKIGYNMSLYAENGYPTGTWVYNCSSYYPGNLFDPNMVKGGVS
jgi:hypothetical protein